MMYVIIKGCNEGQKRQNKFLYLKRKIQMKLEKIVPDLSAVSTGLCITAFVYIHDVIICVNKCTSTCAQNFIMYKPVL